MTSREQPAENPVLFQERWRAFARQLGSFQRESDYSNLWRGMIQSFEVDQTDPTTALFSERRGYSFRDGSGVVARSHEGFQVGLGAFAHTGSFLADLMNRVPSEYLPRMASSFMHRVLGRKARAKDVHDWRYPAIRRYLNRSNVDVDFWLSSHHGPDRIKRSYNALKSVYFADRLSKMLQVQSWEGETVLEIGAGTGNLAILVARSWRDGTYVIVDLPEMILMGSAAIHTFLPHATQVLPHELESCPWKDRVIRPEGLNFVFVTPEQVDSIPLRSVRLSINVESFAEMDQDTVAGYVRRLYALAKPGGMVFTANRESREVSREGDVAHITAFWMYPFRQSDELLLLEYCPMRDAVFDGRDRNINRLARVGVAG